MMPSPLERLRKSMRHRPWTIDVVSGLTGIYWGAWVFLMPETLNQVQFDFLDPFDPRCVGLFAIALGMSQVIGALLNFLAWRWTNALLMALVYAWIAFGILQVSKTPGVTAYSGWSFANLLVLFRLY
jgi:hypothetical protein